MSSALGIQKKVEDSIWLLHAFFQQWFTGAIENKDEKFSYVLNTFGDDFTMVTIKGDLESRAEVIAGLKEGWGRLSMFQIFIEEVRIVYASEGGVLAQYLEKQVIAGDLNMRRTTVLFKVDGSELIWKYVHETALVLNPSTEAAIAPV